MAYAIPILPLSECPGDVQFMVFDCVVILSTDFCLLLLAFEVILITEF